MIERAMLLLGAAVLLLHPGTARAEDECQSNEDCPLGQVCGVAACKASPCDPDDGECPPPVCEESKVCVDAWFSDCAADADCPAGWACEVIGTSACAAPGCPAGEQCTEPEPELCEAEEERGCVPPPPPSCQAAGDCAAGLVCLTVTYSECSGGSAIGTRCEGEDCPEVGSGRAGKDGAEAEPDCQVVTEGFCVPRYVAPCRADADCGPGFRCVQEEICQCSGGSREPASGGGSGSTGSAPVPAAQGDEPDAEGGSSRDPAPVPDREELDCSCEPGETRFCELLEADCSTDADCPADLSCAELPARQGKELPPDPMPGSGEDSGGPEEEPAEPSHQCVPPDWMIWGGLGGAASSGSSSNGASKEEGSSNPYRDALAGSVGADELQGAELGDGDAEGGSGGAGGGSRGQDGGGCALASAPAGQGPSWCGLLALAALALLGRVRRSGC